MGREGREGRRGSLVVLDHFRLPPAEAINTPSFFLPVYDVKPNKSCHFYPILHHLCPPIYPEKLVVLQLFIFLSTRL